MIKVNELRIGSWVLCEDNANKYVKKPLLVSNIGSLSIWCYDNGEEVQKYNNNVHPIELTPTVLEACGMAYDKHLDEWFLINDYVFHTTDEENVIEFDYCIKLCYLHQLQNLYFVLTGEELEIDVDKLQYACSLQ